MREVEARLKISAIDRTGTVLSRVGNQLAAVNAKAVAYNRTQGLMYRAASSAAAQMAAFARYAVPAAATYELYRSTKAAGDFEETLFNIQKKSGATTEQMAKLGDEIRSLAKHDIPMSVDEIAAAFERGAAAGIPLDELKQFSKLATQVADAWDTSAEDVGNFFAGFNKGLNIPLKDMQSFASLINDLADSGISDEKDIADFVDRVGASLKNFGMTPNEIAAYGAAMLNLKMPADVAARAMDTISGKLLAPENLSPKARTALTAIVGDLGKFSKLTGNQKMIAFLKDVEKLSNQKRASLLGALLGEGFDDEIMRLVGGSDELRRNLEMAEKHTRSPSDSIAGVSEKKLELFNSRVKLMKNQLADIELSLGQRVLPYAEKVVQSLSKGLQLSDEIKAGRDKSYGGDPTVAKNERKEFERRWMEAFGKDERGRKKWWSGDLTRAYAAVGRGEAKDIWDYLEQLKVRYDSKGRMTQAYSHGYVPGRGPENLLEADPSTGKMPVPGIRPTKAELAAQKILDQLKERGDNGRDTSVAAAKMRERINLLPAPSKVSTPISVADRLEGIALDAERRRKKFEADTGPRLGYDERSKKPGRFSLIDAMRMDVGGMSKPSPDGKIEAVANSVKDAAKALPKPAEIKAALALAEKVKREALANIRYPSLGATPAHFRPKGVRDLVPLDAVPVPAERPDAAEKRARTLVEQYQAMGDRGRATTVAAGRAADNQAALADMSRMTTQLEEGGQKLKDGAEAGGQRIEESGQSFAQQVQQAASALAAAAQNVASTLSNIRIPTAPAASSAAPAKVNVNTGKNNAFVSSRDRQ